MPGKLGLPEILIILAIALLIFGPSKLADLGKGLGEGIKNFKAGLKDGDQEPGRFNPQCSKPCSCSIRTTSDTGSPTTLK